ncbi:SDR family oxidoreductase [Stappia taiwanensis]|uniref:3-dehydrosphinganine reductase n=1 Tax=Stappia taiwanensis TaxID=992267 RepID=A0A838XMJ2_9HYPH|nr:SDR family oxidoreductase [Stappia taiwanensis]MBA4612499.1 SDR family oxidoreductase [Stappia taiwanensis]GGF05840.1 3-ketodihydrosphingosine reductase [Stappia taiwanensis]
MAAGGRDRQDGRPVALITGGSSGIGLALAGRLAGLGFDLALVSRRADRLEAARQQLAAMAPEARIGIYPADVADAQAGAAAVQAAIAEMGPPDWAVLNAGIARPGHFLDQPVDDHHDQMATNYFGALNIARVVAPEMAEAGGGRMVFVSSGAAFFGIYGYAAYAPSKFALRGLAEVLRVELAGKGISVTLAYPPDTDTPQLVAENETKPAITQAITAGGGLWSAERVAERIVRGASRGRFLVAPGAQMTMLAYGHSMLAPLLRRYQMRIARKERS